MIARFPYFSFKNIQLDERVPFARILLMIGVLALIALDPPLVLWCLSFVYALSGLLQHVRRNVVKTAVAKEQGNERS
jgi:CDP-diacylglycerol--serine O-phosphatidyltransferase